MTFTVAEGPIGGYVIVIDGRSLPALFPTREEAQRTADSMAARRRARERMEASQNQGIHED